MDRWGGTSKENNGPRIQWHNRNEQLKVKYHGKYVSPKFALPAELIDKDWCANITQPYVLSVACGQLGRYVEVTSGIQHCVEMTTAVTERRHF
jgi:hypothetical protein